MEVKLRWTRRAKQDLIEIGRYIARDKREAAQRWVKTLRKHAERAAEFPMVGRRVPELMREDVREIVFRGYRIVYLIGDGSVFILTVFDGHRLLPDNFIED